MMAAKALGMTEVPCIRLDHLTDEQRRAYALAHNKTAELSEWDLQILPEELGGIFDIDMSEFGFDMTAIEGAEESELEEVDVPEQVETRCQLGDLYQLGDHRLMCGDSTDAASIKRLMGGALVNLVLTDPPYGISIVGKDGKIGADKKAKNRIYSPVIADGSIETARAAYKIACQVSDKIIFWGGNYFLEFLKPSDGWLVWDKRVDMNSNNFADGEMAWCSFHTPVRIYHQLWAGMIREGESEDRVHPTQKPVRMLGEVLRDFSKTNDVVLDMFGGSGSTLIACEQMERRCYMIELDPHYCDVIIQRWEDFTGRKAELLEG